jgi:hypothetical protein
MCRFGKKKAPIFILINGKRALWIWESKLPINKTCRPVLFVLQAFTLGSPVCEAANASERQNFFFLVLFFLYDISPKDFGRNLYAIKKTYLNAFQ